MKIPRFLIGDHSDYSDAIFIIHTQYPRFIINLVDDQITWLEDLKGIDSNELSNETANLVQEASLFYDNQIAAFESRLQ